MATSVAIKISFVSARCAARQSTTLSFPVIQRAGSTLQANITPTAPFLLSSHYGTGPSDFQHPHVLHAAGAYPIVIDTGASVSVTPNASDFVGGLATDNLPDLRGLSHTSKVTGTGLVEWSIYNKVAKSKFRITTPNKIADMVCTLSDLIVRTPTCFLRRTNCFELMSVADETNQNLSKAQKELLQWHWKFGHRNFQWVQSLAAESKLNDVKGENEVSLLPTKHKISNIAAPLCAACQLAKQSRHGAGTSAEFKIEDRDMILKRETTEPGDCVYIDQYVSTVLGRLPNTKGKEKKDEKYNGGTIFVDHATGYVHLTHQVSLRAGETIKSKANFERFAMQHGIQIKRYRADNHPFKSAEFQKSLDLTRQSITFSGVGAKHQNGIAE